MSKPDREMEMGCGKRSELWSERSGAMKTGAAFRLLPPVYLSAVTRLSEVTLELAALDVAEVLAGLVELGATPASALLDVSEVGVESLCNLLILKGLQYDRLMLPRSAGFYGAYL